MHSFGRLLQFWCVRAEAKWGYSYSTLGAILEVSSKLLDLILFIILGSWHQCRLLFIEEIIVPGGVCSFRGDGPRIPHPMFFFICSVDTSTVCSQYRDFIFIYFFLSVPPLQSSPAVAVFMVIFMLSWAEAIFRCSYPSSDSWQPRAPRQVS